MTHRGTHRATGDIEIFKAMYLAVASDNALARVVIHASCAHVVRRIRQSLPPVMGVKDFHLELPHLMTLKMTFEDPLNTHHTLSILVGNAEINLKSVEAKGIAIATEGNPAFAIGSLLKVIQILIAGNGIGPLSCRRSR